MMTPLPKTATKLLLLWLACMCVGFLTFFSLVAIDYLISAQSHPHIDLSQCPIRLSPQQAPLFALDTYYEQFNRTGRGNNGTILDEELCSNGFQGNSDAYGLGVRIGLYIQWASSVIANQTLPETRMILSQTYLLFQIASLIAILVMTVTNPCVFSVEIFILYTMFFGGYFCVFCMPNLHKKSGSSGWLGMTWTRAIIINLYMLMSVHAAWFWIYGFDQHFVTHPCGSSYFIFVQMSYSDMAMLRVVLAGMAVFATVELMVVYPLHLFLFHGELQRSIMQSSVYQGLFPRSRYSQLSDGSQQQPITNSGFSRIAAMLERLRQALRRRLPFLRLGLYQEPTVLKGKRKTLNKAIIGAMSSIIMIWSITSIELMIKWNNISGVNTLGSTGQYVPLSIGACGSMSLAYALLKTCRSERTLSEQEDEIDTTGELHDEEAGEADAELRIIGDYALDEDDCSTAAEFRELQTLRATHVRNV